MGKVCPKCGFENPDEAVFCEQCGNKMTEEVQEEKTVVDDEKTVKEKKIEEPKNEEKTEVAKKEEQKQEVEKKAETKNKEEKKQIALSKNVFIGIGAAIAVIIVLLIVLIVIMASKGCGDGKSANKAAKETEVTEEVIWDSDEDNDSEDTASGDVSKKDIKVVDEYEYNSYGDLYKYVIVKNNGKGVATISGKGKAYDSKKKIIGTSDGEELNIDPGATSFVVFTFDDADKIKSINYDLEVEATDFYKPGINSIKSKFEKVGDDKIIVTAKNTSNRDLEFAEGTALFFKGKKLVYVNSTYFTDSSDTMKKGKTEVQEIESYEKFDSVKLYFTDSTSAD